MLTFKQYINEGWFTKKPPAEEPEEFFTHGTSSVFADHIRQHGLKPAGHVEHAGATPHTDKKLLQGREGVVFGNRNGLGSSAINAHQAASVHGGDPVIVTYRRSKNAKVTHDNVESETYESGWRATQHHGAVSPEDILSIQHAKDYKGPR